MMDYLFIWPIGIFIVLCVLLFTKWRDSTWAAKMVGRHDVVGQRKLVAAALLFAAGLLIISYSRLSSAPLVMGLGVFLPALLGWYARRLGVRKDGNP